MPDDAILRDAQTAPAKGGLEPHREAIQVLRDKGYSWREIAQFLTERGVATDHTAVYRFFTRTPPLVSSTPTTTPVTIPSAAQYEATLFRMHTTDAQRLMLETHYRAPNRTITYTELARAVGFEGGHEGANLQYGKLGRFLGEIMGFAFPQSEQRPNEPFYSGAIGMGNPWPKGDEFELVMHHELAKALDRLDAIGWFKRE